MNEYQWKMKGFGGKIDPEAALTEIQKAENLYGKITAETVLNVAKDENSVLHGLFEWDDNLAAERYRISQARTIINNLEVKVVTNNGSVDVPVFEIVSSSENGKQYKHIEVLSFDEIQYVKENTIRQINQLKQKLSFYKVFSKAIPHLDNALLELNN